MANTRETDAKRSLFPAQEMSKSISILWIDFARRRGFKKRSNRKWLVLAFLLFVLLSFDIFNELIIEK